MENKLTKGQKIKYLDGYRWAIENIKMLTERLEKLNGKLYGLDSKVITDMPRGGLGIDSVDILSDKIDIETELFERLQGAFKVRNSITGLIQSVNDTKYRMILEMRYLDMIALSEIAKKFGYSYKHICRLHGEALERLVLENNEV